MLLYLMWNYPLTSQRFLLGDDYVIIACSIVMDPAWHEHVLHLVAAGSLYPQFFSFIGAELRNCIYFGLIALLPKAET